MKEILTKSISTVCPICEKTVIFPNVKVFKINDEIIIKAFCNKCEESFEKKY